MIVPNYTTEDLKKLPLRAIVAFAARSARRVEHLAVPPDDCPERERYRAAVNAAVAMAEEFARGVSSPSAEAVVREVEAIQGFAEGDLARENAVAAVVRASHATVCAMHAIAMREEPKERRLMSGGPPLDPLPHLADVTADLAALDAYSAAVDAADAVGYTNVLVWGITEDYQKLLKLNLGSYPHAGKPIDPSPTGPLGPLGPEASAP
jgi:hypothetical protein